MKITLGTAQIGFNYGIKNNYKKIKLKETNKILNSLSKLDINYIDTAHGYGNAEKILGNFDLKNKKLITKLPKLDLRKNINNQINYFINLSLNNLNKKSIYALLLHNSEQILSLKGKQIFNQLQILKKNGKVKKIGYSLYSPNSLHTIINKKLIPDIVQIPYNILDQRFEENNFLTKLKKYKIEIHARSVFLQGLLLMKFDNLHNYFDKYKSTLNNFQYLANELKLTNFELALYYVLQNSSIDNVVIGVDSYKNLHQIIKAKEKFIKYKLKKIIFNEYDFKKKLSNPTYWKI
jgi:aryl-alcohol dehydrogenase-like predicted oxidoreductase